MGKLSVLWSLKSVLAWLCWGLWFNDVRPGILLQCNDHQMVQSSLVANGMLNSFISTRLDRRHLLTCGKFFTLFNSRTVFQLFGSKTWWGLNLFHFAFLWVPFCLGIPDVFKGVTIHFFLIWTWSFNKDFLEKFRPGRLVEENALIETLEYSRFGLGIGIWYPKHIH